MASRQLREDKNMKITEFNIEICRENVFALIECFEGSETYDDVAEEYEAMLPEAYKKIEPIALLEFGDVDGFDLSRYGEGIHQALYCVTSVGGQLSQWSTQLFAEGDYLGGMLADAIADDYLFQMDHQLQPQIIAMCREKKCGVSHRLEAPQDIPMEVQKKALAVTGKENSAGIRVLDSCMYDPVKTTCQVYLTSDHSDMFRIHHNCASCPNVNCSLRNVSDYTITLHDGDELRVLEGKKGHSLMEILQEQGIFLPAVCAGRGTCGKCGIQVLEGNIAASEQDEKFFSEEQLQAGFRLACKAYPEDDCVISVGLHKEEEFAVLADDEQTAGKAAKSSAKAGGRYGIAVDIGTTTIAMQLINLETREAEDVFTTINRQRAYGADVISRIEASNGGKKEALRKSIQTDLLQGIKSLTENGNIKVEKMVIGANTTMVHLLMGYSCETLGVFPFTPVNIDTIHTTYAELFQQNGMSFEIVIFPGISTYVGGDIVAGLYALDFDRREKVSVLVDLGTNGEMAIGNKDRILTTSTAAGPAFEGGNITFGTGSVPGAICKVELKDGHAVTGTIQDAKPVGICGTGVIDAVYELVKAELVDETGLMEEDYFDDGFPLTASGEETEIAFFQKDVREIQLAKSAVRAGLETLILNFGASYDDIDAIYIAGGFGYKMDIVKAVGIGLLPKECQEKIEAVGNSCLKGARTYLLSGDSTERVNYILGCSSEVQLSNDKHFNEFYMDYMYFE